MTILALEFSSEQRSVACARDGQVLAEVCSTGGRSTQAMSMIENVLGQAGVSRDEVEGFIIGLGPGSYTGIRTALAVAQGWQLVKMTTILGIGSVPCLAAQARQEKILGHVDIVIDAQKTEVYHSTWNISGEEIHEINSLKICPAAELSKIVSPTNTLIGPEGRRWRGDGVVVFPTANSLCRLASSGKKNFTSAGLQPIYLREVGFVKAPPSRSY